jgi:hypothetical protein
MNTVVELIKATLDELNHYRTPEAATLRKHFTYQESETREDYGMNIFSATIRHGYTILFKEMYIYDPMVKGKFDISELNKERVRLRIASAMMKMGIYHVGNNKF